MPMWRVLLSEFCNAISTHKTGMEAYQVLKKFDDMSTHLDTTCDRWTMERQNSYIIPHISILMH